MNDVSVQPKPRKRRWPWYGASLLAILALLLLIPRIRQAQQIASPAGNSAPSTTKQEVTLACSGRIEAVSESIKVGAGIDGLLKTVLVREGDQVRAGQEVAVIDRADLEAERQAALAGAESARQTRARLLRGSRTEERRVAASQTIAAEARLMQARLSFARTDKLFQSGDVSADAQEQAARDLRIAEATLAATTDQEKLVNADPLPEELAKAEVEIKAAEERVRNITERLKKCSIKAPISGQVLRVHLKPGEMVSTVYPQPILSIGDTSVWRVRAEVDERDLARIRLQQSVLIQSEAFGGTQLHGTVAELGATMGRKQIRTGDPAEKSDRDILEVLIDLAPTDSRSLVVGLRVTVQFLALPPLQK